MVSDTENNKTYCILSPHGRLSRRKPSGYTSKIIKYYQNGWSLSMIANKFKTSSSMVERWLRYYEFKTGKLRGYELRLPKDFARASNNKKNIPNNKAQVISNKVNVVRDCLDKRWRNFRRIIVKNYI